MSVSMRRLAAIVAALVSVAALGGCFAPDPVVNHAAPPAVRPAPAGWQDPADVTDERVVPKPAGTAQSCDPRQSRHPDGQPAPSVAAIQRRGLLRVGVDQNTFLFGYRDPATNNLVGFDLDIAREVARAIFGDPNKVQFVAITYGDRITALEQDRVDLVADTFTITCARLEKIDFSTVYYDAVQKVLVPKASKAKGLADLGGQRVCATAGSTSIANIAAAKSKPIPVAVNDWTDCLVLYQQGQVQAISTDDVILAGLAAQDPTTKIVGDAQPGQTYFISSEPYGLGINRNRTDLTRFVNGVLDQIRANGEWQRIAGRWLGAAAPPAPPAAVYGR